MSRMKEHCTGCMFSCQQKIQTNLTLACFIHHICINLLVPSAQKINIENPGNQVNYWGGGFTTPLILLASCFSNIDFLYTGNQQLMQIWSIKLLLVQKHQWTRASLISLNSFVKNTFVGLNFNYLFLHHT